MLPVIQEQLLFVKMLQGAFQTLLCLSLGYLVGEVLFSLPGKAISAAGAPLFSLPPGPPRPKILTGKRTGLLIALFMACNLLLMKIAYRPDLFTGPFWGGLTVLFIIGLALILVARQHLRGTRPTARLPLAAALTGDLLLLAVCFFLLNAESFLLTPESWPFLASRPLLLLSWNGTLRFMQFALLALMLTGLDRQQNRQWLILGAALLWPPFQILELLLIPELARSPWLYLWAALTFLAAAALALMTTGALRKKRLLPLAYPLSTVTLLAIFWVLSAQTARETTLSGVALAGLQLPPATEREPIAPVDSQPVPQPQAPPTIDGGQLFAQKCSVCHRFDQRLIGPPLSAVLVKYRSDKESLAGFLRNPQKIDPDYPAMPNLNLTQQEAEVLTDYLLDYETVQPTPQ